MSASFSVKVDVLGDFSHTRPVSASRTAAPARFDNTMKRELPGKVMVQCAHSELSDDPIHWTLRG